MARLSIKQLKEKIPVNELIEYLGGDIERGFLYDWAPTRCPFHDDKNASASTSVVRGAFCCHACGVKGDIIKLAKAAISSEDNREAMDWLQSNFI